MEEHFGGHVANAFTFKFGIPNKPRAATKIESHLYEAIVHGQTKTVTLYASFVAQRFQKSFAQCQGCIFNGVVLIHFEVAFYNYF